MIYAFAWDYDAVGNRTRQEFNGEQTYYEYDTANALTRSHDLDTGWSYYEYDSRGNCLQAQSPAGTQYFTYDHRNLLSGIRYRDASTQYFHYDAQMRMYALDDNGAVTYYTWDRNGLNPLVERDSGGSVTAEYQHGYARIGGSGTLTGARKADGGGSVYQYALKNDHGDVLALVDAAGARMTPMRAGIYPNLL